MQQYAALCARSHFLLLFIAFRYASCVHHENQLHLCTPPHACVFVQRTNCLCENKQILLVSLHNLPYSKNGAFMHTLVVVNTHYERSTILLDTFFRKFRAQHATNVMPFSWWTGELRTTSRFFCTFILQIIAFLSMVGTNASAIFLPINGVTTAQISDELINLFTPADATFSIWSFIYTMLIAYVFAPLWFLYKRSPHPITAKVRTLFVLSCTANCTWIFFWHYRLLAFSVVSIFVLLLCLVHMYVQIHPVPLTWSRLWTIRFPIALYLGWIIIAAIANAAAWLVSINWDRFGMPESFWTCVLLLAGAIAACAMTVSFRDITFSLVALWGYFGILYQHIAPSGYNGQFLDVVTVLGCAIGILGCSIGFVLWKFMIKQLYHA